MGDVGRHFDRSEFACRCGCGRDGVDPALVSALDELREYLSRPVVITSGVRCEGHNRAVGGPPESAHLRGLAADIRVDSSGERHEVISAIFALDVFRRIGMAGEFFHVDLDGRKPQRVVWTY
jgi:hypothetical protein